MLLPYIPRIHIPIENNANNNDNNNEANENNQ